MRRYVRYECPNCVKTVEISGSIALRCEICKNLICSSCSKKSICQKCQNLLNPSQLDRMKKAYRTTMIGKVFSFAFTIIAFAMMAIVGSFTNNWILGILALILCLIIGGILLSRLNNAYSTVCNEVEKELGIKSNKVPQFFNPNFQS